MSERKPSLLLRDILKCIEHINKYTDGLTFKNFAANYMILEACLYNIQVIGEAVSKLPDDIKTSEPAFPWALKKGMRNRLVHEYFGTDIEIVWRVVNSELPAIVNDLTTIHEKWVVEGR